MTPSELKYQVESRGTESHFFSRANMKFSGDTMRNYGVRSATIRTMYDDEGNFISHEGIEIEVWELYRKRPVKHGLKGSAYFRKSNFKQAFTVK